MRREVTALLEGNLEHVRRFESRFEAVQDGQRPAVVTVCCADSRVLQDHLWANDEPGRLFTCSNIGNRVVQRARSGDAVSGDVLYPIVHTGTEVVIVVGHTGCGAVTAAYDALTNDVTEPSGIAACLEVLTASIESGVDRLPSGLSRTEAVNRLVEFHVDRQVETLLASDDVPDRLTAVGVVYDFQDVYPGRRGEVHVINVDETRRVVALRDAYPGIGSRVDRLWEY